MEAIKYLKTRERLCRNNKCESCPLYKTNNGTNMICTDLENVRPEKIVEIVEQWKSEHPAITRIDEFIGEHPNTRIKTYYGEKIIDICPALIDSDIPCHITGNCYACKIQYWNEEVEE